MEIAFVSALIKFVKIYKFLVSFRIKFILHLRNSYENLIILNLLA